MDLSKGLWPRPPACALALLEVSLHFRTTPPLLLHECNRVALRTNRSMLSSFEGKCSAKSENHILLFPSPWDSVSKLETAVITAANMH